MGDRFSLQPKCSVCGYNLEEDQEQLLLMAPGEFINLTCPKCETKWRFWLEVVTRQKKIEAKKKKTYED